MKFLVLLALSTSAFAQTDETGGSLAYRQDVVYRGKIHELYQNPKGDNVLISKEEAKKHGVFLFQKARKALTQEGLFQLGFGFGLGTFGRERILADREQQFAATGLTAPWAPNDLRTDSKAQFSIQQVNTGRENMSLSVAARLPFYRHLRVTWAGEVNPTGVDTNYGPEHGTHPNTWSYAYGIDHDIWVIPTQSSFTAISVGYFAAKNTMTYEFSAPNPNQNAETSPHANLPSVVIADREFKDSGLRLGARWVWAGHRSAASPAVNFTVDIGREGHKRFTTSFVVGFGGINRKAQ